MTLTLCIYLGLLTTAQLLLAYRQHLIFQSLTQHLALITQLRNSLNTVHENMLDESADVAELKKRLKAAEALLNRLGFIIKPNYD
jgi:hypothetical protein